MEEGWTRIYNNGILRLQQIIANGEEGQGFPVNDYMQVYETAYNLCIDKPPFSFQGQLYERFEQSVCLYFTTTSLPAVQHQQGDNLVKEFIRRYNDHLILKNWMCNFFRYINRFYIPKYSKLSLADVCFNRFRSLVFNDNKERLSGAIVALIRRDRMNEVVDRAVIRDAVKIFVDMGVDHNNKVYQQDLELPFLEETSDFYGREASGWLDSDSAPDYLRKMEMRVAEEARRLRDFLHPSTESKLNDRIYQILSAHLATLLNKPNTGLRVMLTNNATTDLSALYRLCSMIPQSLPVIARIVRDHIMDVGNQLVEKLQASKDFSTYVASLMTIHSQFFDIVVRSFKGDTELHKALKDAFEAIVNKKADGAMTSVAELLVDYCDQIFRKGGVRLNDKASEQEMDKVIKIFLYFSDKDLFAEFYRKQLARRLLLQRSESMDAEKMMIGKLKIMCGSQFTSKLEGMMNDVRASMDLSAFVNWQRDTRADMGGIEMTVQTLTTGFWPTYPIDDMKLPGLMDQCLEHFTQFYATKTSNRKLKWVHNLGVVTIKSKFNSQVLELTVSTIQAAVLYQFNNSPDGVTIAELITRCGINADNMKRQLKSLVSGPFKILLKVPVEGYDKSHVIKVNTAFKSNNLRLRIPSASTAAKVTPSERQASQAAVTEDRKHAMEACVVRVMKARRTLEHNKLMLEVSRQLMEYFQPDPILIKKRIEDLIARDFLKRDDDQSNVYHYVA